jgi:Domain of unknown function (DUF4177)
MATEVRPAKLAFGEECPSCGARQEYAENKQCHKCGVQFTKEVEVATGEEVRPLPPKPPPGTKEYKVLTQRDEWFKGKFDPEKLQAAINHYAVEGWRMVGVAASDVGSWMGSFAPRGGGATRQELVIFLERTVE